MQKQVVCMHCSSEVEVNLEVKMLFLYYYLLTFTFEEIGKNYRCFYVLGKTKAVLLSTVCIGHSPAERKAAELWLCFPFLSVKGSSLTDL